MNRHFLPLVLLLAGCVSPSQPITGLPPMPPGEVSALAVPVPALARSSALVAAPALSPVDQFAARLGGNCLGVFHANPDGQTYTIGQMCLVHFGVCCILSYNSPPVRVSTGTNAASREELFSISNAEAARFMALDSMLARYWVTLP